MKNISISQKKLNSLALVYMKLWNNPGHLENLNTSSNDQPNRSLLTM